MFGAHRKMTHTTCMAVKAFLQERPNSRKQFVHCQWLVTHLQSIIIINKQVRGHFKFTLQLRSCIHVHHDLVLIKRQQDEDLLFFSSISTVQPPYFWSSISVKQISASRSRTFWKSILLILFVCTPACWHSNRLTGTCSVTDIRNSMGELHSMKLTANIMQWTEHNEILVWFI
jgi:hypothetical protein